MKQLIEVTIKKLLFEAQKATDAMDAESFCRSVKFIADSLEPLANAYMLNDEPEENPNQVTDTNAITG